jgi:hypothetical protein
MSYYRQTPINVLLSILLGWYFLIAGGVIGFLFFGIKIGLILAGAGSAFGFLLGLFSHGSIIEDLDE